jgi:hypothetical protein
MMSWLARQDGYDPNAFDVLGEQSTNVGWANRMGDILTARPQYDETVQYKTASPLVQITEGDIGRATEAAMGVSGGGMKVEPVKGIKAFHSSPHDFDKFDLARIGTGEGAQSYGHGLYFAENPAVSGQGGQYWQQFKGRFEGTPEAYAANVLESAKFDRGRAVSDLDRLLKTYGDNAPANVREARALLESDKPVGPRTYEVNINADPAHMLDWDKALSAQPQAVQEMLARYKKDKRLGTGEAFLSGPGEPTGQNIYSAISPNSPAPPTRLGNLISYRPDKVQASERLREAGIPGIKYLDQGSRGVAKQADELLKIYETPERVREVAQQAVARGEDADYWQSILRGLGDRSHNYVIFDPNIVRIDKKYVVPGAIGAGGMGALAAQDRYQPQE